MKTRDPTNDANHYLVVLTVNLRTEMKLSLSRDLVDVNIPHKQENSP